MFSPTEHFPSDRSIKKCGWASDYINSKSKSYITSIKYSGETLHTYVAELLYKC